MKKNKPFILEKKGWNGKENLFVAYYLSKMPLWAVMRSWVMINFFMRETTKEVLGRFDIEVQTWEFHHNKEKEAKGRG